MVIAFSVIDANFSKSPLIPSLLGGQLIEGLYLDKDADLMILSIAQALESIYPSFGLAKQAKKPASFFCKYLKLLKLKILNLDCQIILQKPKLKTFKNNHKASMEKYIESTLKLKKGSASVKACTAEKIGSLVEKDGSANGIKIMTMINLDNIKNMINQRVGFGFDRHKFKDSEGIFIIGGQEINYREIMAHSDGDVALHALTNALLGSIAAGDIGDHFPDTDPRWKGKNSTAFLEYACKLVKKAGFVIQNINITIIASQNLNGVFKNSENLKLDIRNHISRICEIEVYSCNIALQSVDMGCIARDEGIDSFAVINIVQRNI